MHTNKVTIGTANETMQIVAILVNLIKLKLKINFNKYNNN